MVVKSKRFLILFCTNFYRFYFEQYAKKQKQKKQENNQKKY